MFFDSWLAGITLTSPSKPMVPFPMTVRDAPILAVRSDSASVVKSCTSVEPSEILFLDAAQSHIKYFSSSVVTATMGWSSSGIVVIEAFAAGGSSIMC